MRPNSNPFFQRFKNYNILLNKGEMRRGFPEKGTNLQKDPLRSIENTKQCQRTEARAAVVAWVAVVCEEILGIPSFPDPSFKFSLRHWRRQRRRAKFGGGILQQ
jgi:hypothetical protein